MSTLISFGSGEAFLTPRNVANPTPRRIAELQEISVEFSFEKKELYGNKQFPIAQARGKGKISGKAKSAIIDGSLISTVFTGATSAAGMKKQVLDESHAFAATVTIAPPESGTFSKNLQVKDANGAPMTRVAATPQVGEYAVNESTGAYTFNASQTGSGSFSYVYGLATGGRIFSVKNQLMGLTTPYTLDLFNVTPDGLKYGLKLFQVSIDKIAMAFKGEEFALPDMDFSAVADPTTTDVFEFYDPTAV